MRGVVLATLAAVALAACGSGHSRAPTPTPTATPVARPHRGHRRDRAVAALPAAPAQVRGAAARRMPIPILTYHVIATPPAGAPYPGLWVPTRTFAAQMESLRRAGYHAITLAAAFAAWRGGAPLPRRPVVLSFDDGYLGDYTHARPVLRRLGWPGVLNLLLANVRRGDLTARDVRGLIRAGWEVDSHTLTHPDLTTTGAAQLYRELAGSRAEIRRRFGQPADFFCYPSGRYDARVVAAVRAAGYRGALTEDEGYGVAAQPYTLKRVRVQGGESPAALLAALRAERPR
jgi:peptidoglycan/xylan/chitin deacetylase (PgdA/CDA1 family)